MLLDRIPEAMQYLLPDNITNIAPSPVSRKITLTTIVPILYCLCTDGDADTTPSVNHPTGKGGRYVQLISLCFSQAQNLVISQIV